MAVTTTQVCVKLDHHTLAKLDAECNVTGIKRNRLINIACDFYIDHLDAKRLESCGIVPDGL